ncbi:MAG: hypothetical protein R2991_05315 [Thermoanaerobaculia bacterium]
MSSDREAPTPLPEDLSGWREVWESDRPFPITSGRRVVGPLVVALKKLLRPLWRAPLGDLLERQRAYNVELIARIEELHRRLDAVDGARQELHRDLLEVRDDLLRDVKQHHRRLEHLEGFKTDGLADLMRHVDALFSRLDQKIERLGRPAE